MSKPKKNAGKMPAFQFYPADWRKDSAVQSLDYETRGVWFEMLCIMHESSERGVLLLNGAPMPEEALARLLGLDNQNLSKHLTKMQAYGVAKRRQCDGALFNKRMVEDERLCEIRRNAGKKGGNPLLLNQNPTSPVNQNPTPSSSSSSSNNITAAEATEVVPPTASKAAKPKKETLADPRFTQFKEAFIEAYETATGTKYAFQGGKDGAALSSFLKTFQSVDLEQFTAALDWCRNVASSNPYAKGCVNQTANLAAFCSSWNQIVEYHLNYQPPKNDHRTR